jgi:hypothetical protein
MQRPAVCASVGDVVPQADRLAVHLTEETDGVSTPLSTLSLGSSVIELRRATLQDLRDLVILLAADPLGSSRESAIGDEDLLPYQRAFDAIDADSAHCLSSPPLAPSS